MKSESSKRKDSKESLFVFLTDQCNLSCQHCYVESGPHRASSMPYETFHRCLDLFTTVGVRDVRFTGGEPTLHPGFERFVRDARTRDCHVRLITNGIRIAKQRNLLENVDECWVSIYAMTSAEYSEITGAKRADLDRLLRDLCRVAEAGRPLLGISVLLRPATMGAAIPFLDVLAEAGIRRIRFIPFQPDGRGAGMSMPDVLAWRQALADLLCQLRGLGAGNRFEMISINDVFDLEERYRNPWDSCLLQERWMWSIVPNGDIYTCCFNVTSESHRIGNVWTSEYNELVHTLNSALPPCRGLEPRFWGQENIPVSCPLSRVNCETRSQETIPHE